MKIAEILRKLADELEKQGHEGDEESRDSSSETPLDTFTPPLQQKLELLKRSVGIDNIFDGTSIDKTEDHGGKELEIIKKHAGILDNPTAIEMMADDEPLDN